MRSSFFFFFLLIPTLAIAASGHGDAHGEAHLTPEILKTVMWQALNVTILVVGIVYFAKDAVKKHFRDRKEQFVQAAEKAQAALKAAEQENLQIKVQLTKLESTADETLSRAKAEAADLRNQIRGEAEAMSERIRKEAEETARLEVEKAKFALRKQLIQEAASLTKANFENKVSTEEHRRLQGDFIQNIGAVQQ